MNHESSPETKTEMKCIWNRQEKKIMDLIICWTTERGNSRLPTARAVWFDCYTKTIYFYFIFNYNLIESQFKFKFNSPWVGTLLCFHFYPSQLARTILVALPCSPLFHSFSLCIPFYFLLSSHLYKQYTWNEKAIAHNGVVYIIYLRKN